MDLGPTFECHDSLVARCLTCNALLLRGPDESEEKFAERAQVHAERHAQKDAWP